MKVDLTEQTVIVTGAGRGIGAEIARMAGAAGARVVLASRTAKELEEVAGEIEAAGGRALVVPTDLMDGDQVDALVKRTGDELGRIDVLVNNAGTNLIANLLLSKEEDWRSLYELNVFSVVRLTKAVLRPMVRAKYGRIINISSVSSKVGASYNSAYASSKGAIDAFTRSVALETAKLGITVNAVCPWHVDTELLRFGMGRRGKMFGMSPEAYMEKIASESPMGRLVTAREVAAAAIFLASAEASGITGQTINVSGGAVVS